MPRETYKKYYKTCDVLRPTKLAAGMSETAKRSGHVLKGDALGLAVRGTLDKLSSYGWSIKPVVHTTYILSDSGKRKLERLKRKLQ